MVEKNKKLTKLQEKKKLHEYNLVGRPTKYRIKYSYEMIERFTERAGELYYDRVKKKKTFTSDKGSSNDVEYIVFAKDVPTFEEYAETIQVSDHTLSDWTLVRNSKGLLKHPEFLHSYTRCKQIQRRFLLINGLNGTFQSNIAQFLLLNHYPNMYKNKQEVDLGGQKGNPIKVEKADPKSMSDEELDDAITNILAAKK